MNSPELLTDFELCDRRGYWSRDWERGRITFQQLLEAGIKAGLTSTRMDYGQEAGEAVISLAAEREIVTKELNVYDLAVHHASLADVLCHAIRTPHERQWGFPEPTRLPNGIEWQGSAFMSPDGSKLRRVILVSHWDQDRHYSFCRSWETIGNIAAYTLPMQLAICVLGPMREGKHYGYFSRAYRHPINKGLRFRKRTEGRFKESWSQIFREDFDDIPTLDWLSAMHSDGVLADSAFSVTVDVPSRDAQKHVLDLASRKLDKLMNLKEVPDERFTGCSWPVRCPYISPCHAGMEPNGRFGFVRIDQIGS